MATSIILLFSDGTCQSVAVLFSVGTAFKFSQLHERGVEIEFDFSLWLKRALFETSTGIFKQCDRLLSVELFLGIS